MLELYKLKYESKLKEFPHNAIMEETDSDFQWISNRIKRSLEEFRNKMGGSGKIKILKIEPSTHLECYNTATVELTFDVSFRFRSNDKSVKKNLHNAKISIKTDIETMKIDVSMIDQELYKMIGDTPVEYQQVDPYPKYIKISDLTR